MRALRFVMLVVVMCAVAGPAVAQGTAARRPVTPAPAKSPSASARSAAAARTLDATHIEGEIPVPQVLFITARDQRRFMEFQHRRYLRSSVQIGQDTALPSWIVVTHGNNAALKEAVR